MSAIQPSAKPSSSALYLLPDVSSVPGRPPTTITCRDPPCLCSRAPSCHPFLMSSAVVSRTYADLVQPPSFQLILLSLTVMSPCCCSWICTHRSIRCRIPEFENDTFTSQGSFHEAFINASIPPSTDLDHKYSQCTLYANRSFEFADSIENRTSKDVVKCNKWVFDEANLVGNTITTEFDLVCDNTIQQSHAGMVYMVGVLVGSVLVGIIADLIGRKITLCCSITMVFAINLILVFAPNFLVYTILRFFAGVAIIGCWNVSFIIGLELVGPSKRVFTGIVIEIMWCAAELILAALAYWLKNWRYLQISFTVIYGLFLPYWYFMPESSRWLISVGKSEKARRIIEKVAKVNKVEVPKSLAIVTDTNNESIKSSIVTLISRKKLVVRILIILLAWFVASMGYYGLTLNSGRIGGNIYVNYTVSVVMELVAYFLCLFLMDRIGRKLLFCISILVGGVACLVTIFTVLFAGPSLSWITLTLSFVGKLGVSAAFATVFVFTTELFPTNLRSFTLGTANMLGKVGSAISPYVADLELLVSSRFGKSLPLMVFGISMILAGSLSLLLPETLNTNLPDTVEEAENLRRSSIKTKSGRKYNNSGNYREDEELKMPLN